MILFKKCPVCDSNNLKAYSLDCATMTPHISRVVCKSCAIVFANPMADAAELSDFYQNYYDKGHFGQLHYKDRVRNQKQQVEAMSQSVFEKEAWFIAKYSAGTGNFLDVGCGLGIGLMYAKRFDFKLYATELDQDAIEFVQKEFDAEVFHGDLLYSSYPDEMFDYIYINHVIEHVLDPVKYIAEMNRLLKPGGTLFIGTPNISSFLYKTYRFVKFMSFSIPGIVDGLEHTFLFNKSTLRNLCESVGLKMVMHKNIALGESIKNILRSNLPFQKKINRYITTRFNINQEMILRKPEGRSAN